MYSIISRGDAGCRPGNEIAISFQNKKVDSSIFSSQTDYLILDYLLFRFPWTVDGQSMDCPWTVHGQFMDRFSLFKAYSGCAQAYFTQKDQMKP